MKDLGFDNLGFINIAIIYMAFTIASLFASRINKALGTKMTLFLSALTYTIWTFCFMLPAYRFETKSSEKDGKPAISDLTIKVTSLLSATILGVGAGPLWVSQA